MKEGESMIVSLNGLDNAGKTTQTKQLSAKYPESYIKTLHIKDMPSFDYEKYDYNWWFNPNNKEEFVNTIYKCLEERNLYAKSIENNKIVLLDKGNDFYDSRILATLIMKGMKFEDAIALLKSIKQKYNSENIEDLKIFLISGKHQRKEDFFDDKKIFYNAYLEINKIILKSMNIDYKYIYPNEIDIVTDKIHNLIMSSKEEDLCKKLILTK